MTHSIGSSARLDQKIGQAFYGGFKQLREVQKDAAPPVLAGHDVLIVSRTGSGKTEAILAPLVQRHLSDDAAKSKGPAILYITPTRALANDLLRRLSLPMEQLNLRLGMRHGEHNDLAKARKPNVLITTPESLDVLLTTREPAMAAVRAVVIDEGHLLYNSQRGFQVASLLHRIEVHNGPIQVAGLSATVANPEAIWSFLRPGHAVSVIQDPSQRELEFHLRLIGAKSEIAPLVDRLRAAGAGKVLIFVNARRDCEALSSELLGHTRFGDRVFVHHSSLSKGQRLETEALFGTGGPAVCIATSTLELGIDIGDIDVVVLYGHPGGWESFLQRVGRGNRRSNKSNVLAVVYPERVSAFYATLAFQALVHQIRGGRFESQGPMTLLGAGVQQILSLLLEADGRSERVKDLVNHFADWPMYSETVVEEILEELVTRGFIGRHSVKNRVGASEGLHRLRDLRLIWGNFPSRSREIALRARSRDIGTIPAVNLLRLTSGSIVNFAGARWRVSRVLPDAVDLDPTSAAATVELAYGGVRPGLDAQNVEAMWDFIVYGGKPEGLSSAHRARFDHELGDLRGCVKAGVIPTQVLAGGRHSYFTFGGRVFNEVLGRWSQAQWFEAGDVYLETDTALDFSKLPADSRELEGIAAQVLGVPAELTVFQSLLPHALLTQELAQLWSRSQVVARTLSRLRRADLVECPGAALNQLKL